MGDDAITLGSCKTHIHRVHPRPLALGRAERVSICRSNRHAEPMMPTSSAGRGPGGKVGIGWCAHSSSRSEEPMLQTLSAGRGPGGKVGIKWKISTYCSTNERGNIFLGNNEVHYMLLSPD